jgi:hypothetical protein
MADSKTGITLRLEPELRAEIERAAEEQHRSLANMVGAVLHDWRARRATESRPAQQQAA